MTKTPEQLAEEYADQFNFCGEHRHIVRRGFKDAFLAGYKAGHAAGFESAMKIHDAVAEHVQKTESISAEVVQHEPLLALTKYQLADDKVMFCVYCNDMHKGDCAEGRGKNHPALRGTQWISVKERLPEENDEVLIYTEGKYIYMARIYKGNEAYPISNGCGCCGSEERYTHWMPLPSAPKE